LDAAHSQQDGEKREQGSNNSSADGVVQSSDRSNLQQDASPPEHAGGPSRDIFASVNDFGEVQQISTDVVTYSKPRNFAERLMSVLQSGVGADYVWWAGEGKAIALHVKNLKQGGLLQKYFRTSQYSVFIRNCNRWCVYAVLFGSFQCDLSPHHFFFGAFEWMVHVGAFAESRISRLRAA
jgi:hypothetical protein